MNSALHGGGRPRRDVTRRCFSVVGVIWRGTSYLWLIMLSSILGALLTQPVGLGIVMLTGDPRWGPHIRCAGWTLFAIVAAALAIGVPSVVERFWNTRIRKARDGQRGLRADGDDDKGKTDDGCVRVVQGLKAIPAVCLIGGFVGLICGAMFSGMFAVVYFFFALSPLAHDGWWPVLSWCAQGTGDGFIAQGEGAPSGYIFLIIFASTVLLMIAVGFAGSFSSGQTRYAVFGSKARRPDAVTGKTATSKANAVKTQADVLAFFTAATGDKALSKLLAEVADKIGRDGHLVVQQGGAGEPYSVEYMPTPEADPGLSEAENKAWIAEYQGLRQQIAATTSAPERDELERKLGIMAHCVCTLHIKTAFTSEFGHRSDAIRKAWTAFKESTRTRR